MCFIIVYRGKFFYIFNDEWFRWNYENGKLGKKLFIGIYGDKIVINLLGVVIFDNNYWWFV